MSRPTTFRRLVKYKRQVNVLTFDSNGEGENRTLLEEMKPESDRLAAAAAAAEVEEEGKAKQASPVESPPPIPPMPPIYKVFVSV